MNGKYDTGPFHFSHICVLRAVCRQVHTICHTGAKNAAMGRFWPVLCYVRQSIALYTRGMCSDTI